MINKTTLFTLIAVSTTLLLNAQIYTPSATIQGTSGNNYVGIGITPSHLLHVYGSHSDSRILLHSLGRGDDANQADLMLWASEPELSFSGVGIGNNVAVSSNRGLHLINTNRGGSYLRLLDNSMSFGAVSSAGAIKHVLDINNDGNVGIGTTNPTAKLEVAGDIKGNQGSFTNSLPNGSTFTSWRDRNDKCLAFSAGTLLAGLNGRALSFFDFPQSNLDSKPNLYFGLIDRNDNNRLKFYADTGGRTGFELLNKSQAQFMGVYDDGNDKVYMNLPNPNSRIIIGGYGDYLPEHKFVVRGSGKIEGNILTDANIGIGTSNFTDGADTYRLSIKGKVRAEEIKVYNTWADYVFTPNYILPSLKEVEVYINKNGHLPNVPSAKEITDNGLKLGEMSKIQQEKIEELTLYLIQQNKEIEELKAQVKLLLKAK